MAVRQGAARDEALSVGSKPPQKESSLIHQSNDSLIPNKGMALNLDWIDEIQVNTSAVERRAQTLVTRRTVKKEWQAAWLLRAITCMDLTTLSGDDTDERVVRSIQDRKSTRLNSSHPSISYAVFCLKKKITMRRFL